MGRPTWWEKSYYVKQVMLLFIFNINLIFNRKNNNKNWIKEMAQSASWPDDFIITSHVKVSEPISF